MTTDTGVSDRKAHDILKRAAELDRAATDVVSVDLLRAAAREAGITESSFEAALSEQARTEAHGQSSVARHRWLVGGFAGVGVAGLLLLGLAVLTRLFP